MKTAWSDNSHEGKLLRYGINKLAKKLKKTEDAEELIKILNAISTAANIKVGLARYEIQDQKLDMVIQLFKDRQLKKFIGDNLANELPKPKD